jgi:hypothetical protein
MSEADDHTPTRVSRAPTESIRHHTPPQPDGTTTNDEYRGLEEMRVVRRETLSSQGREVLNEGDE